MLLGVAMLLRDYRVSVPGDPSTLLRMTYWKPVLRYLVSKNIKETNSGVALSKPANCHKLCIRICETGYAGQDDILEACVAVFWSI